MACLVSVNAHYLNELSDILGGRRRQKDHPHHPVDDLVKGGVLGISAILKLRKEIEEQKK